MLIGTDGCDSYLTTADLVKKWPKVAAPWAFAAGAGKFGGGALTAATTGGIAIARVAGSSPSVSNVHGFWVKFSAKPAVATTFEGMMDSAYGLSLNAPCRVQTDGTLSLMGPSTTVGTVNVCDGLWHWVEIKRFYNAGSANFTIYVDTLLQGSTGGNAGGSPSTWGFFSVPNVTMWIDDDILYDDTAGAPTMTANFPLSPRQITTLRPVSDGTVQFVTLSAGTSHFAMVNEVTPDADATYVEDPTIGNQDLLNFGSLGYTPTGITAVMVNAYLTNSQGGLINNILVCKSGANTAVSATAATPTTYLNRQAAFNVDPATSAAWTAAGVNAAQFGYRNG